MIEITDKTKCSGCYACCNACPKACIDMVLDEEGFRYPQVNKEQCIECGKCEKVCPILHEYKGNPKGKAYACMNKDVKIRNESSSGGGSQHWQNMYSVITAVYLVQHLMRSLS